MTVTREAVMNALLDRLSSVGGFQSVGRRNRKPETFKPEQTPALILVEHSEGYKNASTSVPSVRRLMVKAILYFDVGADQNAVPSSTINDMLDCIDALLSTSDSPATGRFTLGGLVQSVVIDGVVIKAPGDITGKSIAVVPINILLP